MTRIPLILLTFSRVHVFGKELDSPINPASAQHQRHLPTLNSAKICPKKSYSQWETPSEAGEKSSQCNPRKTIAGRGENGDFGS
jgi:hypothetical protein